MAPKAKRGRPKKSPTSGNASSNSELSNEDETMLRNLPKTTKISFNPTNKDQKPLVNAKPNSKKVKEKTKKEPQNKKDDKRDEMKDIKKEDVSSNFKLPRGIKISSFTIQEETSKSSPKQEDSTTQKKPLPRKFMC